MMVRSRVSILEELLLYDPSSAMSNRRSLPASVLVMMPGVRAAAALELERSMMRDSLKNSKEGLA